MVRQRGDFCYPYPFRNKSRWGGFERTDEVGSLVAEELIGNLQVRIASGVEMVVVR